MAPRWASQARVDAVRIMPARHPGNLPRAAAGNSSHRLPGPGRNSISAATVATALATVLLIAGAALTQENLDRAKTYEIESRKIEGARTVVKTLVASLTSAENGQLSYLLTGEPTDLHHYEAAAAGLDTELANLADAALDDPERQQRISHIRELATKRMADLQRSVALRSTGDFDAALTRLRAGQAEAERELNLISAEAQALRIDAAARLTHANTSSHTFDRWIEVIALAAIAVLLLGSVAVVRLRAHRAIAKSRSGMDRFARAFGLTQGFLRRMDGQIIFWSGGAGEFYGYDRRAAIGRSSHDLLCTSFPMPLPEINAILRRDGRWQGELAHLHRDGTPIHVASSWTLHRGEAGEPDTVIETNNDITRLKLAERALRDSELRLRLALNASGQGVWHWNLGHAVGDLTWDARCRAFFGIAPNAPVDYAAWAATVPEDERLIAEAILTRALDPADPNDDYEYEHRIIHADGAVRRVAAIGKALFVPQPSAPAGRQPTCILGTIRDDTAARQAEQERQTADTLLRTIIETTPALIYAKDRQGRILLANAPVIELIGKPWSEIAGRTDAELLHNAAQSQKVMHSDRQLMEHGRTERIVEHVDRPDGNRQVWLSTKAPLRSPDGQVTGLVGVSVDITEQKRLEERQRLMIYELNHRVKNTLATVQAITLQTLRGIDPTIRDILEDRLLAVASAHDILTREKWVGADLQDVVAGALIAFGFPEDARLQAVGPRLMLRPGAALALAMGLHELATNALKYGALSAGKGRVELIWEVTRESPPQLRLVWREQDGPPVQPPGRRGFGSRLIERILAQDLGGAVRINFDDPGGVTCTIEAPLAEVAAKPHSSALLPIGTSPPGSNFAETSSAESNFADSISADSEPLRGKHRA